jgi:hypothetical protein
MFFDDVSQVRAIATKCGTAIFVVPNELKIEIPGAFLLQPEEKTVITIEQVRQMMGRLELKHDKDIFVIIRPAEKMQSEAANAFLKSLEEPGENVHFVLVTSRPSMLLPTILSRAALYYLRMQEDNTIHADVKIKNLAKRLMVAKPNEVVGLAEEITKKKDGVRGYALDVVGTAIEMLYKSYYITGKDIFVKKLPKFLTLYGHLSQNGHIKLQIVANLV